MLLLAPLLGTGTLSGVGAPEPGVSREAATSAAAKLRRVQDGDAGGRSFGTVRLTELEANSYLHYEMEPTFPSGMSHARFRFRPGRPRGIAEIDFEKLRAGRGAPPNPIVDYFIRGTHTLGVEGTLSSSNGMARFHLETVTLDDITLPQFVVDYLIEHYLKPRYPAVAIDRPFHLPYSIDKVTVESQSVLLADQAD